MAKKACAICGRKIGFFDSFLDFTDGTIGEECYKETGLSTVSMSSMKWAESHSVSDVKALIESHKTVDPHQENSKAKQVLKQQKQEEKEADKAAYQEILQNFTDDSSYRVRDIMIDFKSKQILSLKSFLTPYQLFSFADFKGYKQAVTPGTVKKHHGITRGIAGGLIAGPAGAVVGAVTGGSQYEVVRNLSVIMYFKDNQQLTVEFISTETKTSSYTYKSAQQSCLGLCQRLDEVTAANQQSLEKAKETSPTDNQFTSDDVVEQLKKFKQLADDGVITQSDFEAKKKQLLGI